MRVLRCLNKESVQISCTKKWSHTESSFQKQLSEYFWNLLCFPLQILVRPLYEWKGQRENLAILAIITFLWFKNNVFSILDAELANLHHQLWALNFPIFYNHGLRCPGLAIWLWLRTCQNLPGFGKNLSEKSLHPIFLLENKSPPPFLVEVFAPLSF